MRLAVIGMGNEFRCDDGAGLRAADLLRRSEFPGVTVIRADGDGAALLGLWEGIDVVIAVDAMCSGAAAGSVRRFEAFRETLPPEAAYACSCHAIGIAEAIQLGVMLGRLPRRLILYGIEVGSIEYGCELSLEVEAGVVEAVGLITAELQELLGEGEKSKA